MTKADYLRAMLFSLLGSHELVDLWWDKPNKGFDMELPKNVPEEEVIKYLEGFCFGEYR